MFLIGTPGPFELIVILFIVLLVFGVGKLPEIGGAMGKGIRAFKKGQAGEEDEGEKEKAKEESKESETSKS
ncbi:MAG: twin-arginine translocase TatA/TatE family subunit [Chloroflexi bacterium]|nr:twin-arginine translocase TatA/TatE family subunit [Chloroflexota bacterium]MCZ6788673.1 twin-arginine translocase TatA/TatE family subunit [Chloroflexota bacterium]MCZ6892163.1 twin-arginine translocase TatA/TatE family subunit [Chloroflexota bacterium]